MLSWKNIASLLKRRRTQTAPRTAAILDIVMIRNAVTGKSVNNKNMETLQVVPYVTSRNLPFNITSVSNIRELLRRALLHCLWMSEDEKRLLSRIFNEKKIYSCDELTYIIEALAKDLPRKMDLARQFVIAYDAISSTLPTENMLLAKQNPQGLFESFPKLLRSDICDLKPEIIRAIHLAGKRPDTYFVDVKTAQSFKVGQSVRFGNNETTVTAKEFDSRYNEYQVQATMVDLDYGATQIGESIAMSALCALFAIKQPASFVRVMSVINENDEETVQNALKMLRKRANVTYHVNNPVFIKLCSSTPNLEFYNDIVAAVLETFDFVEWSNNRFRNHHQKY